MKRHRFDLNPFAPMVFALDEKIYVFADSERMAVKENQLAGVYEYVLRTTDGLAVWLTVIADESPLNQNGVKHGWYVAQPLTDADARFMVDALAKFTEIHRK